MTSFYGVMFFLAAVGCREPLQHMWLPVFIKVVLAAGAAAAVVPFGTLPLDAEVVEMRRKAMEDPGAPIPQSMFFSEGAPNRFQCRFHRLGPGQGFSRQMTLVLRTVPGSTRRDGFAVDAVFLSGVPAEEPSSLPLWYDLRGRMSGTVTLPAAAGVKESPGAREEFLVWRFLPKNKELFAEWQRAVGPRGVTQPGWEGLPAAVLIDKNDPYSSYLRAAAYMSCREEPLPTPPLRPGDAVPSGPRGSVGTRQSGP